MYCKATNVVNKMTQYLTVTHDILKERGIFDRFKIENTEVLTRPNENGKDEEKPVLISYFVDESEHHPLWLDKEDFDIISRYPENIRDTIFFLLAMHVKKRVFNSEDYLESPFNPHNLSFNEKEIEILTLAGSLFTLCFYYLSDRLDGHIELGKHIELYNMHVFKENDCYTLDHLIKMPQFDIGGKPLSFKITIPSSKIVLSVIEPKEMAEVENNNPYVDYSSVYMLNLTFGEEKDKDNLNEERMDLLFRALEGKVVTIDTNLRDLYFNAHQYLRIANIKEEKLVSITVEKHGKITRYLGGLYSGFSISTSRTEGTYPTLPFPNTRVSIGGQDVDLACSMSEIETALGLY